jgi:hypothetical protein
MIQRQRQSHLFGKRTAGRKPPPLAAIEVRTDQTVPGIPTPRLVAADEPTILGFPVDPDDEESSLREPVVEEPTRVADGGVEPPVQLVTLPRVDVLAGLALVLAGVAAVASLWLPWEEGRPETGSALVLRGLTAAGSGLRSLDRSGLWQPPVIVLGGGLLLLLGVLLFLPARTHRVVGVLSLLIASVVTAGVLFRVAQAGWDSTRLGNGLWCAVAVAALGLLGALKAMLTTPRVTLRHRRGRPEVSSAA